MVVAVHGGIGRLCVAVVVLLYVYMHGGVQKLSTYRKLIALYYNFHFQYFEIKAI